MSSQTCSPFGVLPRELYLIILKFLTYRDETAKASLTILHLALSSLSLHNLINAWASNLVQNEVSSIARLKFTKNCPRGYSRTGLSILCKRYAGICDICTLRSASDEIFTKLQVCHACNLQFFPKITDKKLRSLYGSHDADILHFWDLDFQFVSVPNDSSNLFSGFTKIYDLSDIYEFVLRCDLIRKGNLEEVEGPIPSNGNGYGHFRSPNTYSLTNPRQYERTIWSEAYKRWDKSIDTWPPESLRPLEVEIILLKEFRYKFDPNWKPTQAFSFDEDCKEYLSIAQYWANPLSWKHRPWRISNSPRQPPPLGIVDDIIGAQQALPEDGLEEHRLQCSRICAVFKAFPDILLSPGAWTRCLLDGHARSINDTRLIALKAARIWKGPLSREKSFSFIKCQGMLDIKLGKSKEYIEGYVCPIDTVRIIDDKSGVVGERKIAVVWHVHGNRRVVFCRF